MHARVVVYTWGGKSVLFREVSSIHGSVIWYVHNNVCRYVVCVLY